jgi:hypothetical protein
MKYLVITTSKNLRLRIFEKNSYFHITQILFINNLILLNEKIF